VTSNPVLIPQQYDFRTRYSAELTIAAIYNEHDL